MILPKSLGGLGFRDIYAFNQAMIANPDSLCARISHAKYYRGTSCLEAQPRSDMSYTWRSILRGIELLKKGVVWRVGNGENLNIWSDPWMPTDWTRRPITPRGATIITQVADLISPVTGSWDC